MFKSIYGLKILFYSEAGIFSNVRYRIMSFLCINCDYATNIRLDIININEETTENIEFPR